MSQSPVYQPKPTIKQVEGREIPTKNCQEVRDVSDLLKIQHRLSPANGCYALMDDINFAMTKVTGQDEG